MGQAIYPKDHQAGMRVPKGGSSCSRCEYLRTHNRCGNSHWIKWNDGDNKIPVPSNEYCCDWFDIAKKGDIANTKFEDVGL